MIIKYVDTNNTITSIINKDHSMQLSAQSEKTLTRVLECNLTPFLAQTISRCPGNQDVTQSNSCQAVGSLD